MIDNAVAARFDGRRKYALGDQLAWYAQVPDENFWFEHWRQSVTSEYYRAAETHDLERDDMGRILLENLASEGPHLEAGCGAGYWVAALRSRGFDVHGIEYCRELVTLVNQTSPALPVSMGNALSLGCASNVYGSYLSFGVVEHREEGPRPFLDEAFRVLRPGGRLIISVPFFGPLRRLKAHLGCYERARPELPFYQYGWSQRAGLDAITGTGFNVRSIHRLFLHRLMAEELRLYRRLAYGTGGRFVKATLSAMLGGVDGHMLMIVADKPR